MLISLARTSRSVPVPVRGRNVRSLGSGPSAEPETNRRRLDEKIYSAERETHFGFETVSEEVKAHKGTLLVI